MSILIKNEASKATLTKLPQLPFITQFSKANYQTQYFLYSADHLTNSIRCTNLATGVTYREAYSDEELLKTITSHKELICEVELVIKATKEANNNVNKQD